MTDSSMNLLTLLSTPIQTPTSFLKVYKFNNEELLQQCINDVNIHRSEFFDNRTRLVAFFSDLWTRCYSYATKKIGNRIPLTPSIKTLLDSINSYFDTDNNGVLVNIYETGNNHIPKHRDSMNQANFGVAILSSCGTRIFTVYDNDENVILELPLIHGQLIHMSEHFQLEFLHDVKREIFNDSIQERISFSFHKYSGLGLYRLK